MAAPLPEEGDLAELTELLEGDWREKIPSTSGPVDDSADPPTNPLPNGNASASTRESVNARARGAGAPAWSLLIPEALWLFFSRLELYEADASLPRLERLFHFFWLTRRVVRAAPFTPVLFDRMQLNELYDYHIVALHRALGQRHAVYLGYPGGSSGGHRDHFRDSGDGQVGPQGGYFRRLVCVVGFLPVAGSRGYHAQADSESSAGLPNQGAWRGRKKVHSPVPAESTDPLATSCQRTSCQGPVASCHIVLGNIVPGNWQLPMWHYLCGNFPQ